MIYFLIIYGKKNKYDVIEIIVVLYYNSMSCNLKQLWFIFKLYWKFMKCQLFCDYLQRKEIC